MRSFLLCSILLTVSIFRADAQAVGTWTHLGPDKYPVSLDPRVNGIGRVSQIKFSRLDPQKMYAVSASGGLYISYNNGYTWAVTPGTENMPTTPCSAVCEDYSDKNIIYLATGDANKKFDDFGIWKSTDGGNTFAAANTGVGNAMACEILMHPTTHTNLVAATDSGIWKTTNSATSWTQKQTGEFWDMKANPKNNNTLFATTPTQFYKSTNFGDTWTATPITTPSGNTSIRIAVTAADTNIIYLVTTKGNGQILKSTNGGASFTTVYNSSTQCLVCYDSSPPPFLSQYEYNLDIAANPVNANELLVVAHNTWRSTDGGLTWSMRTYWPYDVHTDMHWIEFNPYNPRQVFNANDGGVFVSTDSLRSQWSPRCAGLSATEIYSACAAQCPIDRQMVSIGTQDNGMIFFDGQWKTLFGSIDDDTRRVFDYRPGDNVWHMNSGSRGKLKPYTGLTSYVSPYANSINSKIAFNPAAINVAFLGKDTIWRSTNINAPVPAWQMIHPLASGGGITKLWCIESCAADSNILYALSNDGNIYRSDNAMSASPTFTAIPAPGYTGNGGSLATCRQNSNWVYLSLGGQVYLSKSKGASFTWTYISGTGLPGADIKDLIHDNYSPKERIFVRAGANVYYIDSTTTSWTACTGLPSIANFGNLMIYNDSTAASVLRVSTYGRGVWEVGINNDKVPIMDFSADKKQICPNDTVHFTTSGYGTPTSYNWSFPGGTPSTSSSANPAVVYSTPGIYNATLIASNAGGNDTVIKTTYINVTNGAVASFTEGFEDTAVFPPLYWRSVSNNGLAWQKDTVGGFGTSAHSIMFDNFNNDGGAHEKMITPSADMDTTKAAFVSFDVAYSFIPRHRDSLVIKASDDCGQTWTTIYAKDSSNLATAPSVNGLFTPTSSQWRKDTVDLAAYLNKTVMLSFENVGHFGNAIYLDNINVNFTKNVGVTNVANAADIQVYPNPTTGKVYITGTGFNGNKLTIECYNIVGELVNRKEWIVNNGKFSTDIDLSQLPRGIYELKIQSNQGNNVIKKITLQ